VRFALAGDPTTQPPPPGQRPPVGGEQLLGGHATLGEELFHGGGERRRQQLAARVDGHLRRHQPLPGTRIDAVHQRPSRALADLIKDGARGGAELAQPLPRPLQGSLLLQPVRHLVVVTGEGAPGVLIQSVLHLRSVRPDRRNPRHRPITPDSPGPRAPNWILARIADTLVLRLRG